MSNEQLSSKKRQEIIFELVSNIVAILLKDRQQLYRYVACVEKYEELDDECLLRFRDIDRGIIQTDW